MSPEDPRHGTRAGYYAHRRAGETACEPCLRGAAAETKRYEVARILGRPTSFPPHCASRRIQALVSMGWTHGEIAERSGIRLGYVQYLERSSPKHIRRVTIERLVAVYDELSMTPAPDTYGARRARLRAERLGYAPPLAWDNIDDPFDQPKGVKGHAPRRSYIDPIVVGELLAGRAVDATVPEKCEAMRRWLAWGKSERALCEVHGWRPGRYARSSEVAS